MTQLLVTTLGLDLVVHTCPLGCVRLRLENHKSKASLSNLTRTRKKPHWRNLTNPPEGEDPPPEEEELRPFVVAMGRDFVEAESLCAAGSSVSALVM